MNNILYSYSNGNANISILEDGSRITDFEGEKPIFDFPRNMDIKITNYCDMDKVCVYCFLPNEQVLTVNGYKNIQDIDQDKIWNYDEISKKFKIDTVINFNSRIIEENILELELEDGRIIKCTKDHEFLTERGYIKAKNLLSTDNLIHIF